jgi:hypothetical protein
METHFNKTLEDIVVKYNDYGTEEYIKQVAVQAGRKIMTMNPFISSLSYPSPDFQDNQGAWQLSRQFQNSFYVGYMDMLLPDVNTSDNSQCAFTRLTFLLDGKLREFVQIANPTFDNGLGIKFNEFIMRLYPNSNKDFAFNRHAIHTLSDIQITGGIYVKGDGHGNGTGFNPVQSGAGSFTPSIQFDIAISGYKIIIG